MTAATRKRYVYIIAAGVILGLLLLHRRRASAQAQNHATTAGSVIPGDTGQGDTSGSATGPSTPAPTPLWGYQWAQAINGTGHSLYTAGVDDTASMSTATRPGMSTATRPDGAGGLRRYVPPGSTLPPASYGPGPNRFA